MKILIVSFFIVMSFYSHAYKKALVSTVAKKNITNYQNQSESVKNYIDYSIDLTKKNLTYIYGSNTPEKGGMDCSGTVQNILNNTGIKAPRTAQTIFNWAKNNGSFTSTKGIEKLSDKRLDKLEIGDLLFWSGTYNVNRKVTHVMIYLGKNKETGKPMMVGASDGRYYNGKKRRGVSVFDFKIPKKHKKAKFIGFVSIKKLLPKVSHIDNSHKK